MEATNVVVETRSILSVLTFLSTGELVVNVRDEVVVMILVVMVVVLELFDALIGLV